MSQPVPVRDLADDRVPVAPPESVRAAFERLASCDGWSDAAWAVRSPVLTDRRVDDRPEAWVEEELRLLEAVEQVKAWADL